MSLDDPRFLETLNFTNTKHNSPPPSTDPRKVNLPTGFSVCVIGASTGIGEHVAYAYAYAGASTIIIASRKATSLSSVLQNIEQIDPSIVTHALTCDVSRIESVHALETKIEEVCPDGIDVVVSVPASSPPFSPNILHDDPHETQQAFMTNSVGFFSVARYLLPHLLKKDNGAKALIAVGSLGSTLMRGFAAQPSYNTSKMAETRLIEYIGEQFRDQGILALSVHPGSVLTRMSKQHCPEEYWPMLKDEPGLCGALCVWASKQAKDLSWLTGRFLSSTWDVDELLAKKQEIIEKDMLKFAMVVS